MTSSTPLPSGLTSRSGLERIEDAPESATPTVQLFVNPHAGSWRRQRTADLKAAFEAAGARVIMTASLRGRLDVGRHVDHVCAVGGDGTVRHVAAAVARAGHAESQISMSVYPLGTVNLLARECGYPSDPGLFVRRALVTPAGRRHYTGQVGDTLILTCASVGPDSDAVSISSPRLKRLFGRAAYAIAFGGLLLRWPRHRLRLVCDGHSVDCEAVYVAKGRFFAGRWSFAPSAAVDQPLLHVVALRHATRRAVLSFAWALLRHREPSGVLRMTCSELTIDGEMRVPFQADGDIVAHLPVRISITEDTLVFA